jgi:NitT/TauT family transport system substrate-binding protein
MKRSIASICTLCAFLFATLASVWTQSSISALRLGIFADADSLPFLACESEGSFVSEGISVQLIRFQSAVERDSAFQAGAVDGIISDVLAVLLSSQAGFSVRITSLTDGRYGIAVSPSSGIRSLEDLKGKSIAISSNTVIHYMVDTFLLKAGISSAEVSLVPVPKMPVRLEMLLGGQVAAAGMPEPFLTTAVTKGSKVLAATDDLGLGAGVLVFSEKALDAKIETIRALYSAYWKAAQKINANPSAYRFLLREKLGFSKEAAETFVFVVYKKPRLPTEDDVAMAAAWLRGKGLLKKDTGFANIIDARALSQFR